MAAGRTPRHARRSGKGSASSSTEPLVRGEARLQKILAAAGFGSRRAAEQYLLDGRVTVNGHTAKLGDSANPASDLIAVDGEKLALQTPSYWILHKPVGVITTMSDPEGRPTVAHLLPARASGVFPVGRLDIETTGLVLLTNDGAMAQTLLHPKTGGEKEYRVVVKGELTAKDIGRLERGVMLDDGRTKPARIDDVRFDGDRKVTHLRLIITEGRNRQIRRMMMAIGRPVKNLARTRIGPVSMGELRRGEARALRAGEVAALLQYVERLRRGESPEVHVAAPSKDRGSAQHPRTGPAAGRGRSSAAMQKAPRGAGAKSAREKSAGTKGASERSGRAKSGRTKTARKQSTRKQATRRQGGAATAGRAKSAGKNARKKSAGKQAARSSTQSRVPRKGTSRKKTRSRPSRK